MEISAIQTYSYSYQYQEFSQVKAKSIEEGSAAQHRIDISGAKTEIFEFRMEVLFNSKTKLGEQSDIIHKAFPASDTNKTPFHLEGLGKLSQSEAQELVSDDGFWGIAQTSQRLADFVITGAGDNLSRLQAGREGIIRGFNEAEKLWGGQLPDISYATLDKALETIDDRIKELGGSALDVTV